MTEKRRQNTGGGHHRPGAGRAELVTACHRFDPARGGRRGAIRPASSGGGRGIIGPARPVRGDLSSGAGCCRPLLYDYVGRRGAISYRRGAVLSYIAMWGGGRMAGGAAVWCWYDVRAGCCCPLLYSYVGRGGGRSPTGAGIIGPARRGAWAGRGLSSGGGRDLLPARASSARRGLSGAICPAGRGAAALSYMTM